MDKKQLLEQLSLDMEIMKLSVERLKSDLQEIRQIDLDLLQHKIIQVYDQVNALSILRTKPGEIKTREVLKPVDEPQKENVIEVEEIHYRPEPVEETRTVPPEPARETRYESKEEKQLIHKEETRQIHEQPPVHVHKPETGKGRKVALHETLATSKKTINDELLEQKKDETNIAKKMQKGKIPDLKTVISLNQKIAFIKELFKGDDKEYKKFIDFIDHCQNYSEAKYFLQSESAKRDFWKEKEKLFNTLVELIDRKFQ